MSRRRFPDKLIYDPEWEAIIAAAGEPPSLDYRPPQGPIRVLSEDPCFVAVDKPALLLTVPGKPEGHGDCLESRVQARFPDARIVHRLDRPTSGVVLMPREPKAHRHIGLQFERRRVAKTYIARVAGRMPTEQGEIDAPLYGDWPRRPRQMVSFAHGRPSLTRWRVLETAQAEIAGEESTVTRLALEPQTGRTHQLRVHLAWIGCPILGDEFYAPPAIRAAAERLQLHAERLSFRHPEGGDLVTVEAPCPF